MNAWLGSLATAAGFVVSMALTHAAARRLRNNGIVDVVWSAGFAGIAARTPPPRPLPSPKSLARRSAQTALYQITQAFVRWMAPFLSFTAEGGPSWDSQTHRTANPSSWKPTLPGLPAW